jgi:hypothetical protein
MRYWLMALVSVVLVAQCGCTPEHTRRTGEEVAAEARITDSVVVRRSTGRLLPRQSHLCLVSDQTGSQPGLVLLQNMQAGLSGYFLSVAVENQPSEYSSSQQSPCPGANYVLYVQPLDAPCKAGSPSCNNGRITDLLITVFNGDNSGIADRITLTLRRSWLSLATDAQADQREVFGQLARALTGAAAP